MGDSIKKVTQEAQACTACGDLPLGPRPVFTLHNKAKIVIIGQAPGTKVHASGIPWDDASGERLRGWLSVDKKEFYTKTKCAIIPMGFCYPGRAKSGDLPPRKECAPLWHDRMMALLPDDLLVLLIGAYAQKYYLGKERKSTLTETVRQHGEYLPRYFPLPHPSPRNNIWLKKNPWFEDEVLPGLKVAVRRALGG